MKKNLNYKTKYNIYNKCKITFYISFLYLLFFTDIYFLLTFIYFIFIYCDMYKYIHLLDIYF